MIQQFADWLVYSLFGLDAQSHLGSAVNFFFYDTIKILILLFVISAIMVSLNMDCPTLPQVKYAETPTKDEFSETTLGYDWNYLCNPHFENYSLSARKGFIRLKASTIFITDTDSPTFIGRRQQHINFKATTLLDAKGLNNNSEAGLAVYMCQWLVSNGFADTPLHFSRFFPMYRMNNVPMTPIETLVSARESSLAAGMNFVYIGNVSELEGENTVCPSCGKLLVRRNGYNLLENHLADGKCPDCGTTIAGRWKD